jgi:hypothetical protein
MKAKKIELDLEIYRSIKDDNTLMCTNWTCPFNCHNYKASTFGILVQHIKNKHHIIDKCKIRNKILLHFRKSYCNKIKKHILMKLININDIVNTYLLPYCDFNYNKCNCNLCCKSPWYYRGWIPN